MVIATDGALACGLAKELLLREGNPCAACSSWITPMLAPRCGTEGAARRHVEGGEPDAAEVELAGEELPVPQGGGGEAATKEEACRSRCESRSCHATAGKGEEEDSDDEGDEEKEKEGDDHEDGDESDENGGRGTRRGRTYPPREEEGEDEGQRAGEK